MRMLTSLERELLDCPYEPGEARQANDAEWAAMGQLVSAGRGELRWDHNPGGIEYQRLWRTEWGTKALRVDDIIRGLG